MHEPALKLTWVSLLNELEGQVWSLLAVVFLHFLVRSMPKSCAIWSSPSFTVSDLVDVFARAGVDFGLEVDISMLDTMKVVVTIEAQSCETTDTTGMVELNMLTI